MPSLEVMLMQDVPVLAAGVLASLACAVVGVFLVLRRMSLMGDAISHAVLPGIVAGFLLAGTMQSLPIFLGAAAVGVLTALFTQLIHRAARIEPGAAMGVVFTVLFALGVIMLEGAAGGRAHLDADCVLYGQMEHVLWITPPDSLAAIFTWQTWSTFPRQIVSLAIVLMLNLAVVALLFKELRLSAFDPGMASAQGINPHLMHYLLMTLTAITVVAAFEAVGSILVVAMLIVPPLAAHLLTNRLVTMLLVAMLFALLASVSGYGAAVWIDTNAAGMIGVALGALLLVVGLLVPGGWLRKPKARVEPASVSAAS